MGAFYTAILDKAILKRYIDLITIFTTGCGLQIFHKTIEQWQD